ncbi:hypothetical protein ElyMa_002260800 [Elysia marginata]|uniref:Uncharacterized protein n=1 Tax=Elysia marginata TaxID=1093978 RepID=A0AAV4FY81_9GAST|nr:hypothetical protein ElyMa_002260800 [Elysia marginata]
MLTKLRHARYLTSGLLGKICKVLRLPSAVEDYNYIFKCGVVVQWWTLGFRTAMFGGRALRSAGRYLVLEKDNLHTLLRPTQAFDGCPTRSSERSFQYARVKRCNSCCCVISAGYLIGCGLSGNSCKPVRVVSV